MVYIGTLNNRHLHAQYLKNDNEHTVVLQVGCDPENNYVFFLHVGLSPLPTGECEFYFFIIKVDSQSGEETRYYSGLDTSSFIPKSEREQLLDALLEATHQILGIVSPKRVMWCTHEANMPQKALDKHDQVGAVFSDNGYKVTMMNPYHGRRAWRAELERSN